MLTMVMTSLNVPPPSAKLQQQQNEKEIAYTKVVEKNRPPTCSLDLLDDDEQVNTMVKYATTHCRTETVVLETQSSLETIATADLETPKTQILPQIDEEDKRNNRFIHLGTPKTHISEKANADGICISVLGKNVRFTQKKFNIITGLWPTNITLEKDYDNKHLQSLLFGSENKKIISCLEVEEIFKNFEFTNDHDVVKVTLAVFIETVTVGKDKKTHFDMDILGRVDDKDVFMSFD
ncbi:Ulp1-like peptidase [Cucumis melo var. makuwa]|uniref:Ulp1-like peptidase n=1 Tax=Cucumis melo var. makuwa TaxID=1194695 RepID=A0A5A7SM09_CUCMM|nr:Ulp1-like peptidase [Cucumis melo var. makuwa]